MATTYGVAERFLEKTDRTPGGCWLWTGPKLASGYGRASQGLAHRVAYEMFVGPIPAGLQIDHVRTRGCTNRHCVNPAHLEAVTPAENIRRAMAPALSVRTIDPWREAEIDFQYRYWFDQDLHRTIRELAA